MTPSIFMREGKKVMYMYIYVYKGKNCHLEQLLLLVFLCYFSDEDERL